MIAMIVGQRSDVCPTLGSGQSVRQLVVSAFFLFLFSLVVPKISGLSEWFDLDCEIAMIV